MRYFFLFIIIFTVSSCEQTEEETVFPQDYGTGLYISTSNGVSFYNDGVIKNQIYKEVNGVSIGGVNAIKFQNNKAYILTRNILYTANIETFESKGDAGTFTNAVDFEFVDPENRTFVVDKAASMVNVVDLDLLQITSDVETGGGGDITSPVFIVKSPYGSRAFIMNGGSDTLDDSTIVAIDYKNGLEPLANIMGSIDVDYNPNSAVYAGSNLMVLCKGIYNASNLNSNTESSLVRVSAPNNQVLSSTTLSGIYNANNLISSNDGSDYYFTAESGVYKMNSDGTGLSRIELLISDILYYKNEVYSYYSVLDSVTYFDNRDVLYINDSQAGKNILYKYDIDGSAFLDTIILSGDVRGLNSY